MSVAAFKNVLGLAPRRLVHCARGVIMLGLSQQVNAQKLVKNATREARCNVSDEIRTDSL
jgi:hypothetical protein